mmetsp:Transcript_110833/g.236755  ORF Transcript_110833/g.236755 Transcript_110833/m.236755 type:complete len:146 (+) Transcript_110833:303-740(+)
MSHGEGFPGSHAVVLGRTSRKQSFHTSPTARSSKEAAVEIRANETVELSIAFWGTKELEDEPRVCGLLGGETLRTAPVEARPITATAGINTAVVTTPGCTPGPGPSGGDSLRCRCAAIAVAPRTGLLPGLGERERIASSSVRRSK